MRRLTLLWIALVAAIGVLIVRSWPAREPDPPRPGPPQVRVVGLAGDRQVVGEASCAGPMLREMRRHPHWRFTFQERIWDDVVDDNPDETLQSLVIDEQGAVWTDAVLPAQTLPLEAAEIDAILAAAERSCVQPDLGEYEGHYVAIGFGDATNRAIDLPSQSPAAIDALAVMERVRARYISGRRSVAEVMTLTLSGQRRSGPGAWTPYSFTVGTDGRVIDSTGTAIAMFDLADRVSVLDWALAQPATVPGPRPVTGTLTIAGSAKPLAFQLASLWQVGERPGSRNPLMSILVAWSSVNRGPVD
jgi:hypothetical protein